MGIATGKLTLDQEYVLKHPKSQQLYQQALKRIPSGITHDTRYLLPFPIYVTHAQGSHKWDVDGNEYIDYTVGHGSLILGHNHPTWLAAVSEQLQRGTHYGACHELEVRWAELVCELVPCAEEVRFHSSGTEATMMAMRLARAFTGRTKILKFQGHFHGWHDYALPGWKPPFDVPPSLGIPEAAVSTVVVLPPNDLNLLEDTLKRDRDIAAVIIEPNGGSNGMVPNQPGFLKGIREITQRHGVLFIMDEVITGFRLAAGGGQEYYGVECDLCTMAKAIVGGLNGAAVAGRRDILSLIDFPKPGEPSRGRITHPGTYNANPLAAAGGVATLEYVKQHRAELYQRLNSTGERLRQGMTAALRRHGVRGQVYGEGSIMHILVNQDLTDDPATLMKGNGALSHKIRYGLMVHGVDPIGNHLMTSIAHSDEDIERTIQAFDSLVARMKDEGDLS